MKKVTITMDEFVEKSMEVVEEHSDSGAPAVITAILTMAMVQLAMSIFEEEPCEEELAQGYKEES